MHRVTRRGVTGRLRDGQWTVAYPAGAETVWQIAARRGAVWATGWTPDYNGALWRWTGTRWDTVDVLPDGANVFIDVTVTAPNNVWVAGSTAEAGFALHYNGSTWRRFALPAMEVEAIDSTGPANVWVLGRRWDEGSGNWQLLSLHWNGRRWQRESIPVGTAVLDVTATAGGTVLAAIQVENVDELKDDGTVVRHTGAGWRPLPNIGAIFRSVAPGGAPGQVVIAGFRTYEILPFEGFIATWTGTRWHHASLPVQNPRGDSWYMRSLDGDGQGDLWAVGSAPWNRGILLRRSTTCR